MGWMDMLGLEEWQDFDGRKRDLRQESRETKKIFAKGLG
jgi:hypothetical protein